LLQEPLFHVVRRPNLGYFATMGWFLRAASVGLGLLVTVGCSGEHRAPAINLDRARPSPGAGGDTASPDPSGGAPAGDGTGTGLGSDPCGAALPTGFCFVSDEDDFIGGGKVVSISDTAGQILVNGSTDLEMQADEKGQSDWSASFEAASGQYFDVGSYDMAERWPFQSYGAPALSIDGDGRGCNELTGGFEVTEIDRDPLGVYTRFSATFYQHCEGGPSQLRGKLNFNANGKPDKALADPSDCDVLSPIGFCYASQVGSPDGNGRRVNVDDKSVTFGVYPQFDGRIAVTLDSAKWGWNATFGGPAKARLEPGHYDGVVTDSPSAPLLRTQDCEDVKGSYDVLAVEYDTPPGGDDSGAKVLHFDVDFSYHCGGTKPELHGKLRYVRP